MDQAAAYTTLALTVTLAVARPRLGGPSAWRITPGVAALVGVLLLSAAHLLSFQDLVTAATVQWRPLLLVTAMMAATGIIQELGLFERLAARISPSPSRAFTLLFALGFVTASLLNNDSAILLCTPLALALGRGLPSPLPMAFAFAVFLSAGVAPLPTSNPMNLI